LRIALKAFEEGSFKDGNKENQATTTS